MKKTLRVAVLAAVLSVLVTLAGCATTSYDTHYPICSVLPSGVAGCK